MRLELGKHALQRCRGDLFALGYGVHPIHQDFRLNDGHQSCLLLHGGIARQRMRVGLQAIGGGNALANGDHRPPFSETGA